MNDLEIKIFDTIRNQRDLLQKLIDLKKEEEKLVRELPMHAINY